MANKAVLAGCNLYPGVPGHDLRGCVNDLLDWENTLPGFSYVALSDGMFPQARFTSEINTMKANARSGDHCVIAWSSHGSYKTDTSGDEADRRDELVCTYDFPNGYMLDDTFRTLFTGWPSGVSLDVFADCCYSGTVTRLADIRHKIPVLGYRYLPMPKGIKVPKAAPKDKAVVVPGMNHCLWAASADYQTSAEVLVGGVPRGLFTYYVCRYLRNYPNETRDQIMNRVIPKVAAVVPAQTPRLECTAANAAKRPFT